MSIRAWHWGKIVLLWAWGGLAVALLLTSFLSKRVDLDPSGSTVSFLASLGVLVGLSIVTWKWLSGKDVPPRAR